MTGYKSYIKSLSIEYAEYLANWYNDEEVTKYLVRGIFPITKDSISKAIELSVASDNEFEFIVFDKETDTPIGVVGLHNVNWIARNTECRTFIGNKEFWAKGYGTEITDLMLKYAFNMLNINKVSLGVNEENIAAVKTYQKVGFKKEGVLREYIYRNNKYYNVILMSILKKEYLR